MKVLNQWLHQYSFEYSDFLSNFIDDIIDKYNSNKSQNGGFDMVYSNPLVDKYILPRLDKIIKENYYAGKNYYDYGLRIYVQEPNTPEKDQSFYHNHAHIAGNICGVFYLNIPDEGGGVAFKNIPYLQEQILKPQLDNLYIFPTWLQHKAMPHQSNNVRICFNWVYGGNIKPIHKFLGTPW